jgi:tryptophan halogenase
MSDSRLRSIVIVGGGTAGWMTAAALAKTYGRTLSIRLVESDEIGTVGVGEATVPHLKTFNDALQIDEAEFMRAVQGTFKLGIQFCDWGRPGDRYIHGFGQIGHDYGFLPFHQYWLKLHQMGRAADIGAYSIHTAAAPLGRFMTSASDVPSNSPLSHIAHAYHFDAGRYFLFLRKYAVERGVVRTEGQVVDVRLRGEDGFIEAIVLKSGERIEGDLFVDCSGFRGLLIEQALHTGYDDWSHWLPVDRALAVPCEVVGPPTPYTRSTARAAGWQWRIPLQHRTGNGYVFSSSYISEDEAASTLLANLDGKPLAEPRLIKFKTGQRRKAWNRNCVAIGLSSGFLEPLESTSIYLIQSGVGRLISLLPDRHCSETLQNRYNRESRFEFERIRDFIILHYHATDRRDTPFWQYCGTMSIPERLAEVLALFRETGRFFRDADEMFAVTSWVQVLVGQNRVPVGYHPAVDLIPEHELLELERSVRQVIANCVAAMPPHEQFIARHCAAPAPAPMPMPAAVS